MEQSMNNIVTRKLKNRNGASLMVALLFFVIMAVIGSVILAAAASGMGTIKDQDKGDQEKYALTSAANLIVDAFADQKAFSFQTDDNPVTFTSNTPTYYVNTQTGRKYEDLNMNYVLLETADENRYEDLFQWTAPTYHDSNAAKLDDIRQIMAEKIFKNKWDQLTKNWDEASDDHWTSIVDKDNTKADTYTFNLDVDGISSEEAQIYRKVSVKLMMDKAYNVSAELSVVPPEDSDKAKEVIGLKLYVKIPFSTDAKADRSSTKTHDPYTLHIDGTNDRYGDAVTETRQISLTDFKWQSADKATITTLEE